MILSEGASKDDKKNQGFPNHGGTVGPVREGRDRISQGDRKDYRTGFQ